MGFAFSGFRIVFFAVFLLVFAVVIAGIVRSLVTANKNRRAPRLTVEARIVAKRTDVSFTQHGNAGDISGAHGFHTTSTTRYYATFEVESGDRMELSVDRMDYGMLIEGDFGKLSFQGTKFLSFERL